MAKITIYSTQMCPFCVRAEEFLKNKGVTDANKIMVDNDPSQLEIMMSRTGGRRSVPQIFIGDTHIGGFDDLVALDRNGGLDSLLAE